MQDLIITQVELFKVAPRWLFLKLTTAEGIVGWGEPVVEGRAATVEACVRELEEHIVGHSAHRIEDFWQMVYRGGFYRGGPVLMSALSGIDQAMWDIKGKALGVPVHELLGGAVRDRMRVYGWIGGETPEALAAAARKRVENGFTAVKMTICDQMEWIDTPAKVAAVGDKMAAMREAVGDEVLIGVDLHGRVHKGQAKAIARVLEPYHPFFLEELVLAENNDALKALHDFTSIPMATGERMYSRWDFKRILEQNAVDIVQPDLSHAGGITEVKKIATLAEAYDVALAPHCPLGPISFAAALQVDFNCINALIQETSLGIHYNVGADLTDYLVDPDGFQLRDGHVPLLTGPGLGIEIDEDKVREAAREGHNWKSPIWRNADGSVTEW
ncbi:galactonate dehydratase [Lewinella marina]|uniref:Galactonate dehydratase n=1 Tax=Neolewinella marina TaxID=438751 RepID=A0A2G0CAR3_9BACT|nr:galactonate dehydratase [Neolewinella marina]NJB87843.1 galactonate dehydratase [Neolewinella marina]PHK97053.1 galactonate dehydratase [Neolewinella marina]